MPAVPYSNTRIINKFVEACLDGNIEDLLKEVKKMRGKNATFMYSQSGFIHSARITVIRKKRILFYIFKP